MKAFERVIAIVELFLIFPATLFMAALFLRSVQPEAKTGRLVDWFAALPVQVGLGLLLFALPLAALIIGSATLLRRWGTEPQFRKAAMDIFFAARAYMAPILIAGATAASGVILVLVAMHMITE